MNKTCTTPPFVGYVTGFPFENDEEIRLSCPEEFDFSSDLLQKLGLAKSEGGFPGAKTAKLTACRFAQEVHPLC